MGNEDTVSKGDLPWRFIVPALSIGLAVGLLIGLLVGVTVVTNRNGTSAHIEQANATQAPEKQPPERWYVWLGNAPASGEPFASESACEEHRRIALRELRERGNQAIDEIGPMSIRQIQGLGYDPRERIADQVREAGKAYCRIGAE